MFLRQISIETRKTLAHPALWLGLAGLALVLGGFVFILQAQAVWRPGINHVTMRGYEFGQGGLEEELAAGLLLYGWLGSLVCAVCAAVVVAYDYPDRSIQVWLTRGLPRRVLFLSRLVVALLFSLAMVIFAIAVMAAAGAGARLFFLGQVDAARVNWPALLPIALSLFWAGLPALALTAFLAVLTRSPLFAAAGTVIYATMLERMLAGLLARLPGQFAALIQYLPGQAGLVLQGQILNIDRAAPSLAVGLPEIVAAWTLLLLFLGLSAMALIVFKKQDLGG